MPEPIVVNGSATTDQVKSTVRIAIGMLAGLGLLSHFLTPTQLAWVQSSDGMAALGALAAAGVTAWAWIERHLAKLQLRDVAASVPAQVVIK